jgi:hypothetical protein
MGKNILIVVFLLILLFLPKQVLASKEAGASASISPFLAEKPAKDTLTETNIKRKVIQEILNKNNSPLASQVDAFITVCTKYDIDCYLLPSITGLESSFGKFTHPGSYNPFGWGGGYLMFNSWEDCIDAVGKGLKENYMARGADTIEKIGPIYAASPTWAQRVTYFHTQFNALEDEKRLYFSKVELE